MQLSDNTRHTLLLTLHQLIEQHAAGGASDLLHGHVSQLDYPPNGGFTAEEKDALKPLQGNEALQPAIRKLLASCAAGVVFDLLNLLDGTSDPECGTWSAVELVDRLRDAEDRAVLHDDFFSTYWDWRQKRKDKNWRLDLLPE